MTAGRCGLCGNKFGQRAEELVHADCVDEMNKKYDRLRERLDQFEAYGFPSVAAALDRVNAAESALAAEREGHRRTEVEKASLRVLLMQMQTDRDHYSSRLAAALAAPPEGGNE